eukprot:364557-Chlamydomonas_euryale.AAC.16
MSIFSLAGFQLVGAWSIEWLSVAVVKSMIIIVVIIINDLAGWRGLWWCGVCDSAEYNTWELEDNVCGCFARKQFWDASHMASRNHRCSMKPMTSSADTWLLNKADVLSPHNGAM